MLKRWHDLHENVYMKKYFLILAVLVESRFAFSQMQCQKLFQHNAKQSNVVYDEIVDLHKFETHRTLSEYLIRMQTRIDYSSPTIRLSADLNQLKSSDYIVDFGSGEGVALKGLFETHTDSLALAIERNVDRKIDFLRRKGKDVNEDDRSQALKDDLDQKLLTSSKDPQSYDEIKNYLSRPISDKANTLGITYKINNLLQNQNSKFSIKSGRLYEDIPLTELPRYKLGLSYYGVFSYTKRLSLALFKSLYTLEQGGRLYIYGASPKMTDKSNLESTIQKNQAELNGKAHGIDLKYWLSRVKGIKVYSHVNVIDVLVIERTDESLQVPVLDWVMQIGQSTTPPTYLFVETGRFHSLDDLK